MNNIKRISLVIFNKKEEEKKLTKNVIVKNNMNKKSNYIKNKDNNKHNKIKKNNDEKRMKSKEQYWSKLLLHQVCRLQQNCLP